MFRRAVRLVAFVIAAPVVFAQTPPRKDAGTEARGKHLSIRLTANPVIVAPGQRISLALSITPDPKIHVYAPGQAGYIPIEMKIDPSPDLKIQPAKYPASRSFYYAPLKETVKVFDRPFKIINDVTLALTPVLRQRAAAKEKLTVTGTLEYQACDDMVCYRPDSVPLRWTISLTSIER